MDTTLKKFKQALHVLVWNRMNPKIYVKKGEVGGKRIYRTVCIICYYLGKNVCIYL